MCLLDCMCPDVPDGWEILQSPTAATRRRCNQRERTLDSLCTETGPAWVSITIHQTCETDVWQHEQAVASVFVRCDCSPQRRRARYPKGKEICLFLAAVPGSGRTDSIKLQVWNTFESLSCFSVTRCDVERAEFIWERGKFTVKGMSD